MRSKTAAGLLGIFGGTFGVHHFYLGNYKRGVLYALFSWTGITAIIGFIEGVLFLMRDEDDFDRKYNFADLTYDEFEEIKYRYRNLKRRRSAARSGFSGIFSSIEDTVLSFINDDSDDGLQKLERLKHKQQEKRNRYRRNIFSRTKKEPAASTSSGAKYWVCWPVWYLLGWLSI